MKKLLLSVLILLIIGVMGYATYLNYFSNRPSNFLIIDINPSVELEVDANNVVISVTALNEDADVLLSDLDIVGMDVASASDLIVTEAIEAGYIDQYSEDNEITITPISDDEAVSAQLQTRVQDRINTTLNTKNVSVLISVGALTDEMKAKAEELSVSYGKYLLITRAVTLNSDLSEVDLAKVDVQTIQKEIQTVANERKTAIALTTDEQKTMLITVKEQQISNYNQKVEALKEQLLEQYKDKNDTTVSDQQKEQVINTLLEQRKEEVKQYVKDVINGNKPESSDSGSSANQSGNTNSSTMPSNSTDATNSETTDSITAE